MPAGVRAEVTTVYVEASPGTTETRLLTALRRRGGGRADSLSLPETVAGMRSRVLSALGPQTPDRARPIRAMAPCRS